MDIKEQIDKLYEEEYDNLVRMYRSRAGANDVEDLVQEAFYRAIYYKDSFNGDLISLDRWLSGILENCLLDLYTEKRNGSSLHNELTSECAVIDPVYCADEVNKVLSKEIGKKNESQRSILYLYFMCGNELREIQKIVGGSYLNINSVVFRFKELIRSTYPEFGEA